MRQSETEVSEQEFENERYRRSLEQGTQEREYKEVGQRNLSGGRNNCSDDYIKRISGIASEVAD